MLKYIGMIKLKIDYGFQPQFRLLVKFSDDLRYLQKWSLLYPGESFMVRECDEDLLEFFSVFEDFTPVTEREIREAEKVWDRIRGLEVYND